MGIKGFWGTLRPEITLSCLIEGLFLDGGKRELMGVAVTQIRGMRVGHSLDIAYGMTVRHVCAHSYGMWDASLIVACRMPVGHVCAHSLWHVGRKSIAACRMHVGHMCAQRS